MDGTDINLKKAVDRIERHLEQFRRRPGSALSKQLQMEELCLIGKHDEKYDNLRKEIHLCIDEYEQSANLIKSEQSSFGNVMAHIEKYGDAMIMSKSGFNVIHLYPTYVVYNEGERFKEFCRSQGRGAYVKSFNSETGEFAVTSDKNEAACFFNKDTIDAFHRVLVNQYKYTESGETDISEGYDDYGKKVSSSVPYKKTSGGWQVSELEHYRSNGQSISAVWYYPNERSPEGFKSYTL